MLLDLGDYEPVGLLGPGRSHTWTHTWNASELDLTKGKFEFSLVITNYNKKGFENRTVYLEDANVTFHVRPFWKGNAFLEWVHYTFS